MSDLECPVCLEPYNLEDRLPRILQCRGSHEVCSACVTSLQDGQAYCPQCRDPFTSSNPNRGLLAALQAESKADKMKRKRARRAADRRRPKRLSTREGFWKVVRILDEHQFCPFMISLTIALMLLTTYTWLAGVFGGSGQLDVDNSSPSTAANPRRTRPNYTPEPVKSHDGVTEALCYAGASDSGGRFQIMGLFADSGGHKSWILMSLRLQGGVENFLAFGKDEMVPDAVNWPLDVVGNIFVGGRTSGEDRSTPPLLHNKAVVLLPNGLCLSFLRRADRESGVKDNIDISGDPVERHRASTEFQERLQSALRAEHAVDVHAEVPRSALHGWYTKPLTDAAVMAALEKLSTDTESNAIVTIMPRLVEFLTRFEEDIGVQELFERFDAQRFLQKNGFAAQKPEYLSQILSMFDSVDVERAGKVRLMFRAIFEYNAAWLYHGVVEGFHGPTDQVSLLQETMERRLAMRESVALSLYIARIQCSGERMFTTGLYIKAAEETNDETVDIFRQLPMHACAFAMAMGARYLSSQGQTRIAIAPTDEEAERMNRRNGYTTSADYHAAHARYRSGNVQE